MYDTSDFQPDVVDSTPGSYGGSHVIGSAPIATTASTFSNATSPVAVPARIAGLPLPLPTNAWWTNLFMGDNHIVPLPYTVNATTTGFGVGTQQSKSVNPNGIITGFDEQVGLKAVETLQERVVTAYDDITVTMKWPTADVSKYLQACFGQGMGLVTMQYHGLTPSISHGGTALLTVNGSAPATVTGTKFVLEFNSGTTWVVYASSSITLSSSLVASGVFTGTLQVAIINTPSDEAILDAHRGTYVTAGTVTTTVSANVANIDFDWTTPGTNPLLMHALPHHMDVIQAR